jgi:hypothetical protein
VRSTTASTIASSRTSIKTLQRNVEYDEDNQSLADSASGCAYNVRKSSLMRESNSLHDDQSTRAEKCLDDHSLLQDDAVSNGENLSRRFSAGSSSRNNEKRIGTRNSQNSSETDIYEVTEIIVTDPYGEEVLYTGSISSTTGLPDGYGRLKYDKAGRWYKGDWKQGHWTGRGQLSNGDGDFYEGGLKNDQKHGFGTMQFADGRVYEGEYVNGEMVEGEMSYEDGSTYSGCWVDGMRHGHGRCVFTDGSIYEGGFKNGERHGYGNMTWCDGGWYVGSWLNDEMHGQGREVRAHGTLRHDGEWMKGQAIRNKKKDALLYLVQ